MPYEENEEEEIIIRNGTLRQFLNYRVKIVGWWIIAGAVLASFFFGAALIYVFR